MFIITWETSITKLSLDEKGFLLEAKDKKGKTILKEKSINSCPFKLKDKIRIKIQSTNKFRKNYINNKKIIIYGVIHTFGLNSFIFKYPEADNLKSYFIYQSKGYIASPHIIPNFAEIDDIIKITIQKP